MKKIRLRDGSTSSSGLLTRDWDFDIEEKEAEFKDDLRAASGIGHRKKRVSIFSFITSVHCYLPVSERACCRSHTLTASQVINWRWKPSICGQ